MTDEIKSASGKKNWFVKICHKIFKKKDTKFRIKEQDSKKKKKPIEICNRCSNKCSRKMTHNSRTRGVEIANSNNSGKPSKNSSQRRVQSANQRRRLTSQMSPILRYFLLWCPCFCCCSLKNSSLSNGYCSYCPKEDQIRRKYNRKQCPIGDRISTEKLQKITNLEKKSNESLKKTKRSSMTIRIPKVEVKKKTKNCKYGKKDTDLESATHHSPKKDTSEKSLKCPCLKQKLCIGFLRPPLKNICLKKKGFVFIRKIDCKNDRKNVRKPDHICDINCKYYIIPDSCTFWGRSIKQTISKQNVLEIRLSV